jgi:glucans biosynthesis protein C
MRTMVVVLVVSIHACATYSHVGRWYVAEPPEYPLVITLAFAFWQAHLQSFFMGLLFLVAGYLAELSLKQKGSSGFARERLRRLGLPTLFYVLVLNPVILFAINPNAAPIGSPWVAYEKYLGSGRFLAGTGPMWLAEALLVFCLALGAIHSTRPAATASSNGGRVPGSGALFIWGAALVAATFLVRTIEPVGRSTLNLELGNFPQYVACFVTGTLAAKGRWLVPLARSRAARWAGWMAFILGPPLLAGVLVAGNIFKGNPLSGFFGGWNLPSLGFTAWEQLTGLGLGLGALAFCSGKLTQETSLARWLNERSFGVYLFHPVVLVLGALALRRWDINPFFKVSLLTGSGLIGSYLISDLGRRIPGFKHLL